MAAPKYMDERSLEQIRHLLARIEGEEMRRQFEKVLPLTASSGQSSQRSKRRSSSEYH